MCTEGEIESETEIAAESMEEDSDDFDDELAAHQERRSVAKKKWITPRLCSALDKAKVKEYD